MDSNSPPYAHQAATDEISLIDLWLILAARKKLIIGITLLCTLVLASFALFLPATSKYVTSIKIGYIGGENGSLEAPASVIAEITELYLPLMQRDEKNKFKIDIINPEGTDLIILKSEVSSNQDAAIRRLHKNLADRVLDEHSKLFLRHVEITRSLIKKLEDAGDKGRSVSVGEGQETASLVDIKLALAMAKPSKLVADTIVAETKGKSLTLFVSLGFVLGFMLAIFSAFFAEFLQRVKEETAKREIQKNKN